MMSLQPAKEKRVVLITGASSGIGAKTAEFLATKGFHVLLTARREDNLKAIVTRIREKGGKADFFAADLSSDAARVRLVETLEANHLVPDVLVNNAGFGWYGFYETMGWKTGKELIAVNIEAVAHLTRLVLPFMLKKKNGRVIHIGSISGKLPEQGIALYAASKAFLDSFNTSLHRELRGSGVTSSVMRLGPIRTEFFDAARTHANGGNVPAERMAIPVDVVSKGVWRLIHHPRKVVYIPFYLAVSPLLETLFGWLIDLVGPLLLGKRKPPTDN